MKNSRLREVKQLAKVMQLLRLNSGRPDVVVHVLSTNAMLGRKDEGSERVEMETNMPRTADTNNPQSQRTLQ